MARVSLRGVSKSFGKAAPAVRDLDLTIDDGELVTLVGPSGCGKSTILNLIAGFERPSKGEVRIDDVVVNDRSPKDRGVAMVFQSYALYPHMTVRGNLAFPLDVAGLDKPAIAARVGEIAARLGLEALLDRRPAELSGGQRQRVALGRALIRRPRLCLFDEPLSNLDAALRGQMRAEIKRLHAELRATFVYVTHDQTEAMTLSDRIAVLDRGALQQLAAPRDIYRRPATTFVAAFLGAPPINLVPPATLALEAPRDVIVGLRPEDVTITAAPPPDARGGAIAGTVYVVEPTGAETWVTLTVGADRLTGRAGPDFTAPIGAPAWLQLDRANLVFFDPASGRRLDPQPALSSNAPS